MWEWCACGHVLNRLAGGVFAKAWACARAPRPGPPVGPDGRARSHFAWAALGRGTALLPLVFFFSKKQFLNLVLSKTCESNIKLCMCPKMVKPILLVS
jgi:hypothetical protein